MTIRLVDYGSARSAPVHNGVHIGADTICR